MRGFHCDNSIYVYSPLLVLSIDPRPFPIDFPLESPGFYDSNIMVIYFINAVISWYMKFWIQDPHRYQNL
jgi:hypothetical protein